MCWLWVLKMLVACLMGSSASKALLCTLSQVRRVRIFFSMSKFSFQKAFFPDLRLTFGFANEYTILRLKYVREYYCRMLFLCSLLIFPLKETMSWKHSEFSYKLELVLLSPESLRLWGHRLRLGSVAEDLTGGCEALPVIPSMEKQRLAVHALSSVWCPDWKLVTWIKSTITRMFLLGILGCFIVLFCISCVLRVRRSVDRHTLSSELNLTESKYCREWIVNRFSGLPCCPKNSEYRISNSRDSLVTHSFNKYLKNSK